MHHKVIKIWTDFDPASVSLIYSLNQSFNLAWI